MLNQAPFVAIVVANFNGGAYLKRFLDSCQGLAYPNYRVFVIDNGSQDGSEQAVHDYHEVSLTKLSTNLGVQALNIGIEKALLMGADYIFYADNDLELERGSIAYLVELMERRQDISIAAPLVFETAKPNLIEKYGSGSKINMRTGELTAYSHNHIQGRDVIEVDVVGASMIRRNVFQTIGLFDPIYFFHMADQDLCTRAKLAGFKVVVYPKAKMWHAGSGTVSNLLGWKSFFFTMNRLIFLKKNNQHQALRLLPYLLLRSIILGIGTEILRGRRLSRYLMAPIFGILGALNGLCYFLSGREIDVFHAKRLLIRSFNRNSANSSVNN